MAVKPFTQDELRTIDIIRKGFMFGVFHNPQLIVNHLAKFFGDGKLTLITNPTLGNSFKVECVSNEYVRTPYKRVFHFIYEQREDGSKRIVEINEE